MSPLHGHIRLLEAAPHLADGLDPEDLAGALETVVVPAFDLEPGAWTPDVLHAEGIARGPVFANLVIDGLVAVDVSLGRRPSSHIYGPGDLLQLATPDLATVPVSLTFEVLAKARIALLDDSFLAAAQRRPRILEHLVRRATEQIAHMSIDQAVSQLSRVDERVLAFMWRLADRWGHRTADAVIVPLPLTHAAIGCLVGAGRPTVSLGLSRLQEAELLARGDDGYWRLAPESRDALPSAVGH